METLNYAIVENGVVTNIIWLFPNTEFENAVYYGDIPVQIGDTYEDGAFYRDGVQVISVAEDMRTALEILGVYS